MDAPGDTQVDPEIFKEFTSGILGGGSMIMPIPKPPILAAEESGGDFVVVSSQEQHGTTSPMTIDDPETQLRPQYAETSPLKLLETPVTYAGRKRDSQGQVMSSVGRTNETPGTVASASVFFGFGDTAEDNGMSLTQAFNATQAKTSPAIGNVNEDVVFQRPSPNFTHARQSSPGAIMSSPTKAYKRREPVVDSVLRSSSEPRADYEPVKHSQERRSRERTSKETDDPGQQDSWGVPTAYEKHYARQRAKQKFDQEAAKSLAGVSAPTPSARRARKRGLVSMRATTTSPMKPPRPDRTSYHGPYDAVATDGAYECSQPLLRSDEDDSPDELSQHEDMFNHPRSLNATAKKAGLEQYVQIPHTSSNPRHDSSRNLSQSKAQLSQPPPESPVRGSASQSMPKPFSRLRSSKDTEVIMDSQPDPSQPAPLRFPSSPSTNQYSINQTIMLPRSGMISSPVSSMIPMPPKSSFMEDAIAMKQASAVEQAEERVPSSPPLAGTDDEITYDEHAYEEHSDEEGRDREAPADDDVIMEDGENESEDALPSSQVNSSIGPGSDPESEAEDEVEDEDDECTGKDDEVPETIEQDQVHSDPSESRHLGEEHEDSAAVPTDQLRAHEQLTISEIDVLVETRASYFAEAENMMQVDTVDDVPADVATGGQVNQHQTDSNELFNTAKEQPSTSQEAEVVNSSADDNRAAPAPTANGNTLLDIANLPDTQHSVDLHEIDLPQLGVDEEPEDQLDAIMARNSPLNPQKKRRTTYSAKKGIRGPVKDTDPLSDGLTSSPQKGTSDMPGWSPPTTQDREAQGTQAAARALKKARSIHSASAKSKTRFKPTPLQTPRAGALKSVKKELLSKSPGNTSPQVSFQDETPEPTTPTRSSGNGNVDIEMADANGHGAEDEQVQDEVVPRIEQKVVSATDEFTESSSGERPLPNRVFAFWPGKGYYPATCIERVSSHTLRVRFDDGNLHTLEGVQIRALDLRAGDQVKVDQRGMKKTAFVVVGFKDKINVEDPGVEFPSTNRHGYATVVLVEKQRESFAADALPQAKKPVDVPVENIYLTTQLWARLKDRTFQFKSGTSPGGSSSRFASPKTDAPIPISTSLRRSIAGPFLLRDSKVRTPSVASSTRSSNNVFFNMAFAITSTNDMVNKHGLGKLISSNGGLLVDEGFHELFDTDSYGVPASATGAAKAPSSSMHGLQLKSENSDLQFVALIAQSHSRSPKFIQALSLNIPCLHLKWVHDSISAGRALPFAKYLLPAGTSTFLDPVGVVRSRDMPMYDPTAAETTFSQMIKERNLMFKNESVLVVTEETAQEPYMFLTHAMGAAEVGQCSDMDEARELIESGQWDWVYVDCKPHDLGATAASMFGKGNKGKGKTGRKTGSKKRKRDGEVAKVDATVCTGLVGEKRVRVGCAEFVIQSLILGALVEE